MDNTLTCKGIFRGVPTYQRGEFVDCWRYRTCVETGSKNQRIDIQRHKGCSDKPHWGGKAVPDSMLDDSDKIESLESVPKSDEMDPGVCNEVKYGRHSSSILTPFQETNHGLAPSINTLTLNTYIVLRLYGIPDGSYIRTYETVLFSIHYD